MPEALFAPEMAPFTLALALLVGLFVLELLFLLIGLSLLSPGAEPEVDVPGGEIDVDVGDLGAAGVDVQAFDIDPGDYEVPTLEEAPPPPSGLATLLGLGRTPVILWLAALLLGFGVAGFVGQSLLNGVWGAMLPAALAAPLALVPGLAFARGFAGTFARILPKTESTAVATSRLGHRRGVVTQGTARRGKPAEVKVTDFHGNLHYIRAEPMDDDAILPRGTDVLVLRHRPTNTFRLIPL